MLSTIVLNWNRDYLLRQCVESYLATAGAEAELSIVDNASSDGSRAYLRRLQDEKNIRVLYLEENVGGEAFNTAIPLTRGGLIHLSENDQIFLPGWFEHVLAAFDAFPELGQLSLFADTPTDDEAWEPKPSHLRFAGGKILYEAHGNVGTSSVIRASLFRERGLRVGSLAQGEFRFPDDARLSADIKALGLWCAWSDRYYARNVGHEIAEFAAHEEYYRRNYASKPWLGESGWRARIAERERLPRIYRASLALPDRPAVPEKTLPAVDGKPARLWSMFDGFTAEVEVLDFLFALTRLVKPARILETGTWLGLSACAMARGLLANGFGRLTTLETNPEVCEPARAHFARYQVAPVVDARLVSSLDFIPGETYDMAVFDSDTELRIREFRRFRPWLAKGAVVVFHDTAPHHVHVIEGVRALIQEGVLTGVDLPTPRGVFLGRIGTA